MLYILQVSDYAGVPLVAVFVVGIFYEYGEYFMKWCFSTRVMVDGIPFLTVEMNRKSWTENNVPPLSSLMPESIITGC